MDEDVKDILERYEKRLEGVIDSYSPGETFSREYNLFREEALEKTVSSYENLCNFSERLIKIRVNEDDEKELMKSIDICHLNITPSGVMSFASIVMLSFLLLGVIVGVVSFVLGELMLALPLLLMITGFVLLKPLTKYPHYLANKWRLEASNQMVLCILYIVMYMRHTSNLERAIKFSAEHIGPPLSLDLRKIFWDVETQRYATIIDSLENYLKSWRKWNLEFIESFHLIEGSLYEAEESRRIAVLEKGLQVMLESTYDKMMHYAHNLKSPITTLHMLGVILPILGLIILPLMGTFLGVKWYHLAIVYNLILPVMVYYIGMNLLAKRPTGYGQRDILKDNPEYEKYQYALIGGAKVDPLLPALFIGGILCLIGLLPILLHLTDPNFDMVIFGSPLLEYRESGSGLIGPFGIGAAVLSLFIPLGIALGMGTYYRLKTVRLIKIREETKALEREFAGSLFQLGNRIGDGLPVELAFGKIAENMKGTPTGTFFNMINRNLAEGGMGVQSAIFDEKRGAMLYFPSSLIESSMEVLLESSRKGYDVVSKSLISISVYFDRINKVNERLKDLLADIISSMKAQVSFLTPMIAGIVVGIGSMITTIIGKLAIQLSELSMGEEMGGVSGEGLLSMFPPDKIIPPYFFQIVVGIYVLEIIFVLTVLANSIENGVDNLNRRYTLGKNLYIGVPLYCVIALAITIVFNMLAQMISGVGVFT